MQGGVNRLTDMDLPAHSPAGVLAAAVQSVEPLHAPPERRAGILVRVLRGRRARRPAFFAFLSPAALAVALVSFGIATAAAAIAPHVRWRWATETDAPVAARRAAAPLALRPAGAGAVPPVAAAPDPPAPRPARPHVAPAESPARLVAAVRALRTEGQPARAERLALDYLRAYPRGALAEEALAVAIHAAVLNGDARAAPLAQRYLRQYPRGRFRRVAEQAFDPLP